MLIECPSCAATYDLPEGSIAPPGRKVRCTVCKTMWLVEPPQAEAGAPSPRDEPAPVQDKAPAPELSIDERFAADDLRLAGLKEEASVAPETPAIEPASVNEPLPARLRTEATLFDDPAIVADSEPDNSQDDIDALFSTPSLADFNGPSADVSAEADDANAGNVEPDTAAPLVSSARKSRARMGNRPQRAPRQRISIAAAAAVALFLGLGMSVLYRAPVVAAVPQTARIFSAIGLPVNLRGVEIRNVTSRIVMEQGAPQLIVEGEIVNVTKSEAKLSRLRFAVRSEKGQEIYSWKATVDKPALAPEESLKFRRRLASPPDGASDVLVRFETRGDMIAGVQ